VLPHAAAKEATLYPAAAAQPGGGPLVDGMLDEHRALVALVDELAAATSPVRAVGAARALGALFSTHLAKENDLVLPLLVTAPEVRLADLLAGMHELLGAEDGGENADETAGTCGCGDCGCRGAAADDASQVYSVDARLDVSALRART
jgi:hypothetical protein